QGPGLRDPVDARSRCVIHEIHATLFPVKRGFDAMAIKAPEFPSVCEILPLTGRRDHLRCGRATIPDAQREIRRMIDGWDTEMLQRRGEVRDEACARKCQADRRAADSVEIANLSRRFFCAQKSFVAAFKKLYLVGFSLWTWITITCWHVASVASQLPIAPSAAPSRQPR